MKIFYRCPHPKKPSGGVRAIYDHNEYNCNPESLFAKAAYASKLIKQRYNRQRQSLELINFWNSIPESSKHIK